MIRHWVTSSLSSEMSHFSLVRVMYSNIVCRMDCSLSVLSEARISVLELVGTFYVVEHLLRLEQGDLAVHTSTNKLQAVNEHMHISIIGQHQLFSTSIVSPSLGDGDPAGFSSYILSPAPLAEPAGFVAGLAGLGLSSFGGAGGAGGAGGGGTGLPIIFLIF